MGTDGSTSGDGAPRRHLLGMEGVPAADIERVLDLAETFFQVSRRPIRKVPTLRGKTVINMFFEPSTRTRTSFELAGKRLSADVVNFSGKTSSTSKGETLRDTIQTMNAMNPHVVVIRHGASGAPLHVTQHTSASVVNAGDGIHEHPTQALLDAYTMRQHKKKLAGLKVAICGDIAHSRVARSNAHLLTTMGAEVRMAGPRTLLPDKLAEALGVTVYDRIEPALEGVDVAMMLRIQHERIGSASLPSTREYARKFGLNAARLALAAPDCLVMHPGPINRGVEIDPEIADGVASVILDQVEAGVAVRMAVLWLLCAEATEPLP
ncbi:MAG: aspartate carbamoyltransferase catalytic subunit [Deltaproteobacteria bacterium]|nr:aspartate carbamoyltransferase catalytic subunit [Deltaproteobacteria bacterium]